MINLLPYDIKKQTRAARINVLLIRYIFISGFAVAFLIMACATTNYYIPIISPSNNTNDGDLSANNNILSQQIKYSTVLTKIASALPTGTILDSLALNDASFGTRLNLKILASSSDVESTIKQNFQNAAPLFSDYRLESTSVNKTGLRKYKNEVNISIVINKGSAQ